MRTLTVVGNEHGLFTNVQSACLDTLGSPPRRQRSQLPIRSVPTRSLQPSLCLEPAIIPPNPAGGGKGFCVFEDLDLHRTVPESVAFVLEQADLDRDSIGPERCGHPFGLFGPDHTVLRTLEEENRTADLIRVFQRRPRFVAGAFGWPCSHQTIQIAGLKAVCVLGHGRQVADGVTAGSHLEDIGKTEAGQGCEAASAAPFDGDLLGWLGR